MKSRVRVREMISKQWEESFLSSPKMDMGMKISTFILRWWCWALPWSSYFLLPLYSWSLFFLEEIERENEEWMSEWEWDGLAGVDVHIMLTCGAKGGSDDSSTKLNMLNKWWGGRSERSLNFEKIDFERRVSCWGSWPWQRGWYVPLESWAWFLGNYLGESFQSQLCVD